MNDTLKTAILEAIAAMYSTSIDEVQRDVIAVQADEALDTFCRLLETAGY